MVKDITFDSTVTVTLRVNRKKNISDTKEWPSFEYFFEDLLWHIVNNISTNLLVICWKMTLYGIKSILKKLEDLYDFFQKVHISDRYILDKNLLKISVIKFTML